MTGVVNLGMLRRCLELHCCGAVVFFTVQYFVPKITSAFESVRGHITALNHNNSNNNTEIQSSLKEMYSLKKPVFH